MILADLTPLQWFLAVLLILVCLTLMVIILLQRGRGGGMAAAFGGGGGGGSAFGAKTGDVFTLFTVILTAVYLLIAVVGNYAFLPPPGVEAARPDQVQTPATGGETPPGGPQTETDSGAGPERGSQAGAGDPSTTDQPETLEGTTP